MVITPKRVAVSCAIVCAVIIYYIFDPAETGFFPPCPSHVLTGYECAGCGTQRALHALLHGDLAGVAHYNAMLFIGIPLLTLIYASYLLRSRHPRFYLAMTSNYVIVFTAILTIFWTVYRNIH